MAPRKSARKTSATKPMAESVTFSGSEQTGHEKAALIALAYMVGFITAYIAFSLGAPETDRTHFAKSPTNTIGIQQASASSAVSAVSNDDGLFVINDGVERIVSARTDLEEYEPGYHRRIATVEVSAAGDFVHYCALMSSSDDLCSHFVYSVDEDVVYRVRTSDQSLDTSVAEAKTAKWSTDNFLTIGTLSSLDATTPWYVE
jgi:hypothetical protein